MARKKIRKYDSKRLLKENLKRLAGIDLTILSAQITQSTDFAELLSQQPWLSTTKLVVKPDMLFGKRGKSGLVALLAVQRPNILVFNCGRLKPLTAF